MIILEDRRSLAQDINTAHKAGARLRLACGIAGIDARTLQRWKAHEGLVEGDGRPQAVRAAPSHALGVRLGKWRTSIRRQPSVRISRVTRF